MEKIIRIENLTFEYPPEEEGAGAVKALNGIGFEIEKGSFTAVLGRNGSGKSTLSKQLNALLIPKEGDVIVCGINTRQEERVWEIRSSAGMVFQNPDNQLISAVVEDDVAFGPENLGIPAEEIRRRIDDAMKRGRNLLICSPAVRNRESLSQASWLCVLSVLFLTSPRRCWIQKDAGRSWRSSGLSERTGSP